jgi:hypothetical protein
MQDGMLVGFVPMVADSAGLDVDGIVAVIAGVDYDQEPGVHPDGSVSDQPAVFTAGAGPARPTVPEPSPPPTPPEPSPPPTPPEQSSPALHPSRLRSSLLRRLSGH